MTAQAVSTDAAIAVVLKGYPRLSETFIAQELLGLERSGLKLTFVSLRHPTDTQVHPVNREISAPVNYLPEYLYQEPLRVLRSWWRVRRQPGYRGALRQFLRDWRRDPTTNRGRRFGQALVMAAELPESVRWLYAHFLHTPASVTYYAAQITGLCWSCSAHAKDVWLSPVWEIREKLDHLQWLVTCTASNREYLATLASQPERIQLLYHGLDFERFPDPGSACDAAKPNQTMLLTVGRAVPKKGLDVLLHALARLRSKHTLQWHHVGGGELLESLRNLATDLNLVDCIEWHGALAQDAVLELYRRADIFVLPCRIADNGDRDGLPNVLMEAQSQRVACVSTPVSGVPELIEHERTGLLVEPDDVEALAAGLTRLIEDPAYRLQLADAGYERTRNNFSHEQGITRLASLFAA